MDKPKREAILDLAKYVNERIRVKFTGGREVTGVLKGYDQLLNLVLDEVQENLQAVPEGQPATRNLGLVVLRGPTITLLSPVDGFEEIANPFVAQDPILCISTEAHHPNIFSTARAGQPWGKFMFSFDLSSSFLDGPSYNELMGSPQFKLDQTEPTSC
ncbi:hypothetical protein ACG7TL_007645 [Trametes sanguinea]